MNSALACLSGAIIFALLTAYILIEDRVRRMPLDRKRREGP